MAQKTFSPDSTNKISLLVLICFFLSGLVGLIYEILWTRMIVKIIGGAPFAVTIILTVFMSGLGLGSFLAGRTIDRIREPIKLVRIYGLLELVIGAYGLAIPLLLEAFKPLYAVLYNQLFSHFIVYNLLTFVGCSILLCIPVICMGATLPILCRFYVTKLSHLGTHAGRLYGLNTVGAALGALLCGFWLINLLGVNGTLTFAVLINGLIGISCLSVGNKATLRHVAANAVELDSKKSLLKNVADTDVLSEYPKVLNGALIIFAVSGFCAMAYEVIWTKLLGLIVGPTTYSFTIVLVTFILGLALGSMAFGWLADKKIKSIWLLITTQIIAAFLVLVISQIIGNSQLFFAKLIFNFKDNFALLSASKAAILFGFMILPTLCLGATFPLVSKIYTQSISKVGRSIGFAYMINTIGAVSGSFCAGFLIIPFLGKENGLRIVISLQLFTVLVIAAILSVKQKKSILKWAGLISVAVIGFFACSHLPTWNRKLLSEGKYHRFTSVKADIESSGWFESLFHGSQILARSDFSELVYYGDGIGGFTTVQKHISEFGNADYSMQNSGKTDASTRGDMMTQTLVAHLPMLLHHNPKTVMVLGLASGITAGEILLYPVDRLDVIEISYQVVEASKFFNQWNNNVLSNPKTNLIIQDGRAHLQLTKQKYDVIISEPSNPWMAGLANLFTRDFFILAKNRLNEDGIFVQWLHSYQMDWDTFALIGRTFTEIFPNGILVLTVPSGQGGDYLLVGFKGKKRLSLDQLKQNFPYIQKSKNVTLLDPKLLYRLIISEDIQQLFGPGPVNTDSRPRLEFAAPKLMYYTDPVISENIQPKRRLSAETEEIIQQITTNVDAQIDFAVYALSLHEPFVDMVDLSKATLSQKERFLQLMDEYCANNPIDYAVFKDNDLKQRYLTIQIEAIENKINIIPDKAFSYYWLAKLYRRKAMIDKAITSLSESLQIRPDNADWHYELALLFSKQGNIEQTSVEYRKTLRLRPRWAPPLNNLAWLLATNENPKFRNPAEAVKLAEKACKYDDYKNPFLLDTLAAAYATAGRFSQALTTAEKALELARLSKQQKLAEELENRLRLYKEGKPYITPSPKASSD
jgi:spermidine synthase